MAWIDDDVMALLESCTRWPAAHAGPVPAGLRRSDTTLSSFSVPVRWPPTIGSAWPTTRSTRRPQAACRRGRVAGIEAVSIGDDPSAACGLVDVWSTRHRSRAVRSGLQRCIVRAGRWGDPAETSPGAEP